MAIFLDENSPFRLAEDVISKLDHLEVEVGLPDLDLIYDEIYQNNTRVGTHDSLQFNWGLVLDGVAASGR